MPFDTKWHLRGASSNPLLNVCLHITYMRSLWKCKLVSKKVPLLRENSDFSTGKDLKERTGFLWRHPAFIPSPLLCVYDGQGSTSSPFKNSSLENVLTQCHILLELFWHHHALQTVEASWLNVLLNCGQLSWCLNGCQRSWCCWACDVAFDVTYMPGAGDEFTMGCLWFFRNSSFQFFL